MTGFKTKVRLAQAIMAVGAVLAVAAGCGAGGGGAASSAPVTSFGPDVSTAELYADAKAEGGTITWYTTMTPDAADRFVAAFQKQYPDLKLQYVRLVSAQIASRYEQERAAGTVAADVLTSSDSSFLQDMQGKGWVEKSVELPDLKSWPSHYYENGEATVSVMPLELAFNTNVSGADEPTSWEDVLDPKYTGKLLLGDPSTVPPYLDLLYLLDKTYGEDFIKKLAAQKPTIVPSIVTANETLASGAAGALIPSALDAAKSYIDQGAPIKLVTPNPTTAISQLTAISAGGNHPAGARLVMDFMLTRAGQAAINVTAASPLKGIGLAIPKGLVDVNSADAAAQRDRILGDLGIVGD